MASPRPLSPAPAFPFLASLSLIQLVPKDTVGYGAVPLILVRYVDLHFRGPGRSSPK